MLILGLCLWIVAINAITWASFAQDKRCAQSRAWRVPEARLLFLALIGGWPAAKLAQHRLRHKTRKQPFAMQLNAVPVLQVLLLGGALAASSAIGLAHAVGPIKGMFTASAAEKPPLPHRFGPGS